MHTFVLINNNTYRYWCLIVFHNKEIVKKNVWQQLGQQSTDTCQLLTIESDYHCYELRVSSKRNFLLNSRAVQYFNMSNWYWVCFEITAFYHTVWWSDSQIYPSLSLSMHHHCRRHHQNWLSISAWINIDWHRKWIISFIIISPQNLMKFLKSLQFSSGLRGILWVVLIYVRAKSIRPTCISKNWI